MWQYIFLLLKRQPGKSALASSGFLLAACALILLSATTQTTVVQANQIISQNWRPTYDLVVLPSQAQIPADQNLPADLLEGYGGGISIQQYEQIKNTPGIEVAAPIAYVGYLRIPTPLIYFSDQHLPPGYYQVDWTLTAFTGQRNIIEIQQSTIVYIAAETGCSLDALQKLVETLNVHELYCYSEDNPLVAFEPPDSTGTFLLAAIDPAAENQLVHLDKAITTGRMLTAQDTIHLDKRIPDNPSFNPYLHKNIPINAVPMLIHEQLPGQIALDGTFTQLYTGSMTPEQIRAKGGLGYLEQLPSKQTIFNGSVPLVQNDPQRFSGASLLWNGHAWQTILSDKARGIAPFYNLDFNSASTPAGLTYIPSTAPDGRSGYSLVPTGVQGPEVAFRDLNPLQLAKPIDPRNPDVYYDYEAVGQFTDNHLAAQLSNPLNWLPENTYTAPPVVLRYDGLGDSVHPTTLLPTTNPASFIPQPPLALTTLAAARELIGERCINAIRVRVAGVAAATQESWKHIQKVAQLIQQQTGLKVVVTLGSSPRPMLVYVPGVRNGEYGAMQDIASVGWVEERWIRIAAGLVYLNQLGQTRLLLLGAVLSVCLGYLVVAFSALVNAQHKEFAVLSVLGWRPWQPIRLFLMQALVLAIGGGIVGSGLALLIAALLEATPIWLVVIWTIPVMLTLALISVVYPLWRIWRIRPAEVLRIGSSIGSGRARLLGSRIGARLMPIGTLVLRNLSRSRPRALITIMSLFFSALLLMLMFNGILALRQTLLGTLLGDYVLLQTAVPQIAGCAFAIILTFLSVTDLLLLQVRERQQEIGLLQAIGWRSWAIQRLFVQEGLTLAVTGTVPGVLVSLWVLSEQHSMQNIVPIPLIACGTVLVMVIVSALAILPALRAVNRMQVVDLLRAE